MNVEVIGQGDLLSDPLPPEPLEKIRKIYGNPSPYGRTHERIGPAFRHAPFSCEETQPARERAGRRLPSWRRGFRRADCRR